MKHNNTSMKTDSPPVRGRVEESLQTLRAALSTPHGTSSEKRERVLSAWSSLKSVTHPADDDGGKKRSSKQHRKRSRHEYDSKGRKEKKSKVPDGAIASAPVIQGCIQSECRSPEKKYKLLHDAARMGQAGRVRELAESGVKITAKDNSGFTALHWASLYGHTEVVRALLGLGAGDGKRINRRTDTGNTSLHLACTGRHAEVAALLQLYKADKYRANCCGQTPVSLGLRELVESVSTTQRVDAAQTRRESSRRSQLHEISDWHVLRDLDSSGTPSADVDEICQKPLRGLWGTWEDYNTAWTAFFNKFTGSSGKEDKGKSITSVHTAQRANESDDTIHFHSVPWPVTGLHLLRGSRKAGDEKEGQGRLLLAELGASTAKLRSLIQQERLRWHPDKFLQVFGRHLSSSDRPAVLEGVQTIIQLLNSLAAEEEEDE